jgi:hypothetical protein
MSQTQVINCSRCRQPLPAGTSYCVACGCNNESLLDSKRSTIGRQLEDRRNWENLCRMFPFLRWFEK